MYAASGQQPHPGRDRSRETRDTLNYDRNQRTIESDLGP